MDDYSDDPAVQCWHTEAGSPCDWYVCRQPDRLVADDKDPLMATAQKLTTAQKLIAYRAELTAGGLHPGLIDDLIRDAAQTTIMSEGLKVTREDQDTSAG
ncbi:hypothetical protein ACFT7S_28250 [Streptomyces sp. NPDC057136]|uniref:hypothetical protein n=1 Tax=Streptomyces sp. NPDC057136 TaxID=3346029 RepID=UPI00362C0452